MPSCIDDLAIRPDDLRGAQTRDLLRLHLQGMHAHSPPGSVFALDLSGLERPEIAVWSAWHGERIAGIAALKALGPSRGEVKSMRVHPDFLGRGVGLALLDHIIDVARARGYGQLSLETGTGPAFEPALNLYRKRGFVAGGPFADYPSTDFNRFLHLRLCPGKSDAMPWRTLMEPGMMAAYRERGFVFVPGLLEAAEIAVVRAELDRILAAHAADPARVILEKDGVTPRTVVNPHLHGDVFARLVRHPALVGAAQALLAGDVYVWQSGVNCKAPFDGDAWFWHQDYPAYRRDDHIPAPRMVNALVFFDEVSALNGPLMLVPGSQALTDDLPEPSSGGTSYAFRYTGRAVIEAEIRRRGVEAPTGPAGSVIFMNVNVLHGSAGNLSPWPRRMMTLTYNAFANKATAPSLRPRHIVPDDRDVPPLVPLGADCLAPHAEPRP